MRTILSILFALLSGLAFSQGPKVPSKMTLGNMKLKITDRARAEIQKNVDDLTRHPKYFNAKVDLANQYFHFIEEAFKKEGVPEEIKYLVIQESGLVSDAVSSSNAVGYWQFKDFTAVEVGMRVDRHIDERKNIAAASKGAAKYLKMNNTYFDNWVYAIQAYQQGAGDALKSTDKKLYGARQMTISKKTYWYVKKFLAHKVAYESAVGKSKPSVYLSSYRSGGGESLKEIAGKFKVDQEQLANYNKWLKKGKVPTDRSYTVVVPNKQYIKIADGEIPAKKSKKVFVKKAPSYHQKQAKLYPMIKSWKGSSKYSGNTKSINRLPGVVGKSGDRLETLARKGNLSLSEFLEINDIGIEHKVIDGQVYYFKKKKSKAKVYYHIVHPGETVWSVAQKYGIPVKKLLMKNRMSAADHLKVGRVLWMRHIRPENTSIAYEEVKEPEVVEVKILNPEKPMVGKDSIVIQVEPEIDADSSITDTLELTNLNKIIYEVTAGDTFYNISKKNSVSVLDLAQWNNLKLTDKLAIGQELTIYTPEEANRRKDVAEIAENESVEHVVASGETLYSISRKYNVPLEQLKSLNQKTDNNVSIGDRLKITDSKE